MTINFSLICQIRDFGSGQILQPRQLYLSPGLAKIAPYLPCHRDNFSAEVPGLVAGWLRQVTFTCPYPLAVMWHSTCGQDRVKLIGFILTPKISSAYQDYAT
jgi:hypothetical protein